MLRSGSTALFILLSILTYAQVIHPPQILFEEDFSDGQFDDYNAGNSGDHWRYFPNRNEGVAFRAPENRPTIPQALSRRPAQATTGWAGVQFAEWNDQNNNKAYNDGEMKLFSMDKQSEVFVLEFEAFSDLARKPETYAVEVAMLEWKDSLAGHPHYNHDLSFEAVNVFHVNAANGPVQLTANVENQENRSAYGVKYAHFTDNNGLMTKTRLGDTYSNLVLWRPRGEQNKTNIEQWGELHHADYDLDTGMIGFLNPQRDSAKFDYIQITLFRGPLNTSNPFLIRDNVPEDSAQVGIVYCKTGITKCADFNLDFQVDSLDNQILLSEMGRQDSINIRTGDANNDGMVDARDAGPLTAYLQSGRPSYSVQVSHAPNQQSLRLTASELPYLEIRSPTAQLLPGNLDTTGLGLDALFTSDSLIVLYRSAGMQANAQDLGQILSAGSDTNAFSLRYNYPASSAYEGIPLQPNQVISSTKRQSKAWIDWKAWIAGSTLHWSVHAEMEQAMVYRVDGKLMGHYRLEGQGELQLGQHLQGLYLIRLVDKQGRQRVFHFVNH